MLVWPDGDQAPQELPLFTANATAVLPIGTMSDGLLVVVSLEGRVERHGLSGWKATGLKKPWAACIHGDCVLVTENEAGRVARLSLLSGTVDGTFGDKILKHPYGVAVGPTGEIVVTDDGTRLVHIFDANGSALRSLGQHLLQSPMGVCLDALGRIYVADHNAGTVVVLDGSSGARTGVISVAQGTLRGWPQGVAVTASGLVVVSSAYMGRGWLAVFG